MDLSRYIVCYPGGGITDMLTVINLCLGYAIKYNRLLLIDTTYKTSWFKHDIFRYIEFNHTNIYLSHPKELYKTFTEKTVYPSIMRNNYDNLEHEYKNKAYYYAQSTVSLCTNLEKAYDEEIVVYCNCATAPNDLRQILQTMKFKTTILNPFLKRYLSLPQNYISVHIRNTDIKSDVDAFLKTNHSNLKERPIYLASDNRATIEKLKTIYTNNLYNFAAIPDNAGTNIHYNHAEIPQNDFIIDCFVDILLLASSETYYYSNERSGYSKFANTLYSDKHLLHKITASILSPSSLLRNRRNNKIKPIT